ncbi:MAG: tRNA (adenosine(37)-N6)-threonylcarbamoyltransferase complex ATPase subunit type 1 TsaE [Deltaproteobacteria bacterium]|nr:MAG: tRNA (adenosine(37)-N6)-threonylcarbamoyltransferase complex ATPase subunit type 1 TsaE [Deltaproteobacteria bacterium]
MQLELASSAAAVTRELGRWLGRQARAADWIGLGGELGAGKTTLVQGLARGAGVAASVAVNSPTFVILQTYPGRLPVHHLDFYRLEAEQELNEIGYHELLEGPGICLVEWFDRLPGADPGRGLVIELEVVDLNRRRLHLQGRGERGTELLELLERSARELGLE